MLNNSYPILIYLDTNLYSRPFDDQKQPQIQAEANAFLEIIQAVKNHQLILLTSDILLFEVYNILTPEKRAKLEKYLSFGTHHIDSSPEILTLGQLIETHCHIRARDALHVASAIFGKARYFLSADQKITQLTQAKCYRRLIKPWHPGYFSAMNPIRFMNQFNTGELK